MENFKKEIFFQEHKAHIFCQPISDSERLFLNNFLKHRYGIKNSSKADFFKILLQKLANKREYQSIDTPFELQAMFQDLMLQNNSEIFVVWKYPDDIDKFDQNYLLKYWDDIWFSTSDEAVGIFFPVVERIIVITHYNIVYY